MWRLALFLSLLSCSFLTYSKTLIFNNSSLKSVKLQKIVWKSSTLPLIRDAYSRLGITIELRYRPDRRSIAEVNSGVADGELSRFASLIKQYPNVMIVPEPIDCLEIVAFAVDPNIDISTYRVGDSDYHIGYMYGWESVSTLLGNYQPTTTVSDPLLLFNLLKLGRLDIVLFPKASGEKILIDDQPNMYYSKSRPLISSPIYMILNKKHAELVPKIAHEIKVLKKELREKANHLGNACSPE